MDKIIQYLSDLINKIGQKKEQIINRANELEKDRVSVVACIDRVENLDLNLLEKYLNEQTKKSSKYIIAKQLKDHFANFEEESQVIEAKRFLNELVSTLEKELSNKIKTLKEETNEYEVILEKYNKMLNILNDYTSESYLDEESFKLLNEIIKNIDIDDEIIDFYISIGKNNVNYCNKSNVQYNDEIFEQIKEDEDLEEEYIEQNDIKEELRNLVSSFVLENHKSFLKDYYSSVQNILSKFERILNNCSDSEVVDSMSVVEEGTEFLEALNNYELVIASTMIIIKSCENRDLDSIKTVVDTFNNNYEDIYEFDEIDSENNYTKILYTFESYNRDNIKKVSDFIKSYESYSEDIIIEHLEKYFEKSISVDYYLIIKSFLEAKDIINNINKNHIRITEQEIEILNNITKNISSYMEERIIDVEGDYNPYNQIFGNYIIFFELDDFMKQFDKLMEAHHDATYSDLKLQLEKIFYSDIDTLKNSYSKILKDEDRHRNEFNIREVTGGNIRVYYKIVETQKIDDHNVVLICGVGYGNTDTTVKRGYILDALSNFKRKLKMYDRIVELFQKCDNRDDLGEEAKEIINMGLEYYIKVYKETLKEQEEILENELESGGRQ